MAHSNPILWIQLYISCYNFWVQSISCQSVPQKKKNYLGFPRFDPFCCNACLETVGFIEKDHKENKLINKSNPF